MLRPRKTCRFTLRSTVCRATRLAIRTRWRAPDDLGAAFVSFRRALRAHRRLARLAPRFFDSAVVECERREREAKRRWMDLWEPAFIKVYGSAPRPFNPDADRPPLPPPAVQRKVEAELARFEFWRAAGQAALERFRQRRPHTPLSLHRIARLYELGFAFGSIAVGYDPNRPQPEPDNYEQALADLERAYGGRTMTDAPGSSVP